MNLRSRLSRAFTLVEMLVVIIIITAMLVIAVPNFQAMLSSSEAALAESQLKAAMRAGKDAALRSTGDQDSAVVFTYIPGGRLTMGIYVKAGQLKDRHGGQDIWRDVFVPAAVNEPVQLPRGWMVRGYAPPYSIDGPSNDPLQDPGEQWYESYANRPIDNTVGNWVFPETHFYDTSSSNAGRYRQTFMVRFQAGSGIMRLGAAETCLIFVPGPGANWRSSGIYNQYQANRADDAGRFVNRVLQAAYVAAQAGVNPLTDDDRRRLLGWESSDMILARPVSQLALYDESKLAAAIGARLDRTTGCVYQDASAGSGVPSYVNRTTPSPTRGSVQADINAWILGDTNLDGNHRPVDGGRVVDAPEAKIFTIDRYTGALQNVEVQ